MKEKLRFDYSKALAFADVEEMNYMAPFAETAHRMVHEGTGVGNESRGWIELPLNYDRDEFDRIKRAAKKIRENSDVLIVIGIGGSYLGSRAAIESLMHPFNNCLNSDKRKNIQVFFAGNSVSSIYMAGLLDAIEGKDISINVISKSGTTTEPAVAFRVFRDYLEKKYGTEGARERIFITTDKSRGALKKFADAEGYETFVIPDDIGGRYSVLTAVGLLPIAAAGIDIGEMMEGAMDAHDDFMDPDISKNISCQYAVWRNILYRKGKAVEILVNYEPSLHYFSEWWKQLFGESEGKDLKGIFPASVDFSTDLHSMGQFIQEGMRNMFETVINIEKPSRSMTIPEDKYHIDGLDFLTGKDMDFVNKKAFQGTVLAHVDGGVPNLIVNVPEISPYYFGYTAYFFEKACSISGYISGINPFDQPGVEKYKRNMYALLGKPGYEKEREELEKRL